MEVIQTLFQEIIGFLGISQLIEVCKTGNYKVLLTLNGIFSVISPLVPFLLLLEICRAIFYKKFKIEDYKMPFLIFVANRFISRFLSIAMVAFCIGLLEKYALFNTSLKWYWFIYGYVIWEFSHFIYHYFGHKVRLFWCLHSTHHAPQTMNLSVTYAHFFLEAPYADVIRTSICILMGVNPPLLFIIMFIDGTWGSFIHVGENLIKDGRLGFLNKIILTPSHHRVHHAKNPLYMDTNFCNLLNIWDKVFGTFQHEKREMQIEYGISREMNPNSFLDVYFGELYGLWKDMRHAPGIKNKLLYVVMPPGWSHTGDHKTAKVVKAAFLKEAQQAQQPAAIKQTADQLI
ncbi:sterol desaturase family protein [Chitinophaga arvensicola]|uniref:Sterol desaturase/sphingolipid hydroxylase, fatty acid hydroxylase superfamily n=1 Tax=Chitinophaga arvensicola TaxID=29529 RepID=A0A1I0S557_9BACT|nr:sterol desaturase family protein [Chitinophaga arvensicola]SEW50059.1 Sterol desaturase/sphingolipid hydroxylase, fatty acid hydroxylase superfamily [Chitinophaga arvensicola]